MRVALSGLLLFISSACSGVDSLRPLADANGQDRYFAGWQSLGTCTSADDPFAVRRDSVLTHLESIRLHGLTTVLETEHADGRLIPRAADKGWSNWYPYTFVDTDGRVSNAGHPRPGAYVEGLLWLMDAARRDVSVIVGLPGFVTPGYRAEPFDGSEQISCAEYQAFIAQEIEVNRRASRVIPAVSCSSPNARRPFWEWNIWYVVSSLADHPALAGWYIWDEAEGIAYRHLFGIHEGRPSSFVGPASLPTTDLLRYVYRLVHRFDSGGHPVLVDIHSPQVFFSGFSWSEAPRSEWSSGPFDRAPDGSSDIPADILGLEASSYLIHPRGEGPLERIAWYWDQNHISRNSAMLSEAAERYGKEAIVIAAQAQLPSHGPYAPAAPLRCEPNDQLYTRLLSDRDLVWEFLTTHINGLRGYMYYSHALMPYKGPGAIQVERSTRLLEQVRNVGLDRVFVNGTDLSERLDVVQIRVDELTDYYRSPPAGVGMPQRTASKRSELSTPVTISPDAYRVKSYNRSSDEAQYGKATVQAQTHILFADHRLLRVAYLESDEDLYLFISNAYDARIEAQMTIRQPVQRRMHEGHFDLGRDGVFRWTTATRTESNRRGSLIDLTVQLEPYEARFYRWEAE